MNMTCRSIRYFLKSHWRRNWRQKNEILWRFLDKHNAGYTQTSVIYNGLNITQPINDILRNNKLIKLVSQIASGIPPYTITRYNNDIQTIMSLQRWYK